MRRQGRELRRAIKDEAVKAAKETTIRVGNEAELERKVHVGKVVARLMDSEDWSIIEDIIMREGRTDSMVALAMKEEVTEEELRQQNVNIVRFGVATRIINRLHLAVELGEQADLALRKRKAAKDSQPDKKARPQSERRGKGSPR